MSKVRFYRVSHKTFFLILKLEHTRVYQWHFKIFQNFSKLTFDNNLGVWVVVVTKQEVNISESKTGQNSSNKEEISTKEQVLLYCLARMAAVVK